MSSSVGSLSSVLDVLAEINNGSLPLINPNADYQQFRKKSGVPPKGKKKIKIIKKTQEIASKKIIDKDEEIKNFTPKSKLDTPKPTTPQRRVINISKPQSPLRAEKKAFAGSVSLPREKRVISRTTPKIIKTKTNNKINLQKFTAAQRSSLQKEH